jgi:hypothetical protein
MARTRRHDVEHYMRPPHRERSGNESERLWDYDDADDDDDWDDSSNDEGEDLTWKETDDFEMLDESNPFRVG